MSTATFSLSLHPQRWFSSPTNLRLSGCVVAFLNLFPLLMAQIPLMITPLARPSRPITLRSLLFGVLTCSTFTTVVSANSSFLFDGTSFVESNFVRFPINQVNPPQRSDFNPDGNGIKDYLVFSRYCLHYPDIMCYERHGNGWVAGDHGAWLIMADTDSSGLGSLRLDFPPVYDQLTFPGQDSLNGLHSPRFYNGMHPLGLTVFITSFSADLRFEPSSHMVFIADVPIERWDQHLYVGFSARPSASHWFALYRRVIYHAEPDDPHRPYDPAPTHTHDEL